MIHEAKPLPAALVRRPRFIAWAIGLMLLPWATAIQAAPPGSAQNPIPVPGTEAVTQRHVARHQKDRVTVRHGSFEAVLYHLPSAGLLPGLRPRLTRDASEMDAVVRGRLDVADTGDIDLGTTGLRLSVDPSWCVAIEGHDIALGEYANPASLVRTRGCYPMTQFGVEVRF